MRRFAALVVTAVVCWLACAPAMAGKRVALVIGNSAYQNVAQLANPASDAAAIADMFTKANFDVVISRRDLTSVDMRRALREFTDQARGADIAVVYYAGHGLEVDGTNYVVPVDAVLQRDADVDDEAVSLNRILVATEAASKLRLVILDACRDNPFAKRMRRTLATRSITRGLVGVEPNRPNTFIAFAAKEGSTASDGDGGHSPFTMALLTHLTRTGVDIRKAFGYVRDDVMSATANEQEPYTTNSLGGDDVSLVPAPAAPPVQPAASDPDAATRKDYELAERVGTIAAWDSFVAVHPPGFYTNLAKSQRDKLTAEAERAASAEKARHTTQEQARLAEPPAPAPVPAVQPPQAMAVVTPPEAAPARRIPPDLPRSLQVELQRVGCEPGDIGSEWNAAARKALSLFNDNAGTRFDTRVASVDALDAVTAKQGRVCPLECDRGYHANGDKCVRITCEEGYVLGAHGSCERRPEREQPRVRHAPATAHHGGRCFVHDGASFCE
jgi:uncharacterized caspase-like protein